MVKVSIDTSEIQALTKDLEEIPRELSRRVIPALNKSARNIKTAMQADLRQSSDKAIRSAALGISYGDPVVSPGDYAVTIGLDKPLADIANSAYFGTSKGGGRTRDPREALEEEIPAFEREIDKLMEGLLR